MKTSQTMPDHHGVPPGDEPELSAAEQLDLARKALDLQHEFLTDFRWWDDHLEGVNPITANLGGVLARMTGAALAMQKANPQGADILAWGIANEFSRFIRNIAAKEAKDEAEQIVESPNFEEALK